MIREKLIDKGIGDNKKFRWRSHEISRIEGLSDAVAFAVIGRGRTASLSGMTYMLCPIVITSHGMLMGKQRRKPEERFGFNGRALLESD